MKLFKGTMDKFYSWHDGLSTESKFYTFVISTFGWLPFMFGTSLSLWAIGYTWLFATALFWTLLLVR